MNPGEHSQAPDAHTPLSPQFSVSHGSAGTRKLRAGLGMRRAPDTRDGAMNTRDGAMDGFAPIIGQKSHANSQYPARLIPGAKSSWQVRAPEASRASHSPGLVASS